MSIIEEIKSIKSSKKDLRKFGITIGSALVVFAVVFYFLGKSYYLYFGSAGLVLIAAGILFPVILKPLNKIWMSLAVVLGWLSSRIILTIVFYLVLTPISIIAKISGKKFLDLKYKPEADTYWIKRVIIKPDRTSYEKQY
jgi:Saxitoxin biosynthesis operon protein SxtJ